MSQRVLKGEGQLALLPLPKKDPSSLPPPNDVISIASSLTLSQHLKEEEHPAMDEKAEKKEEKEEEEDSKKKEEKEVRHWRE